MQEASFSRSGVGVGGGVGYKVVGGLGLDWADVCLISSLILLSHFICAGALHQDGLINLCYFHPLYVILIRPEKTH